MGALLRRQLLLLLLLLLSRGVAAAVAGVALLLLRVVGVIPTATTGGSAWMRVGRRGAAAILEGWGATRGCAAAAAAVGALALVAHVLLLEGSLLYAEEGDKNETYACWDITQLLCHQHKQIHTSVD